MRLGLPRVNNRAMRLLSLRLLPVLALLLAGFTLSAPLAHAADPATPETARATQVKAAFLHKFASFVDWPDGSFPQPSSPLRIGVLGDPQLFQDLSELARDHDRDGRRVTVTRLAPGASLAGFHILYMHAASPARLDEILPQVPEGVLTVADTGGLPLRGSVMTFFMEDGKVRFDVSLEAAQRQRLRLSSRLLTVARNVLGRLAGDQIIAARPRALPLS